MANLFSYQAALGYKQSSVQKVDGKRFIDCRSLSSSGRHHLGFRMRTGELSAYLAELVGPEGKVVAVDPDKERILLGHQSYMYNEVKNLLFLEGSASNFPGIRSESFDIIFCNYVIHWIPDKKELFNNIYESLKHGGKIAIQHVDYTCPFVSSCSAFKELYPENAERIYEMFHCVERPKIEQYCSSAGFRITKSYDTHSTQPVFQTIDSLLNWLWSSTHGAFDPTLVNEERLQRYYPYSSRDGKPPFDFRGIKEESRVCRLVAVKKGLEEIETVHKHLQT